MKASRRVELNRTRERTQLIDEVMRREFASARAYVDASPGKSLEQLAAALGLEGVDEGHLHLLLWEEAVMNRMIEYCARDLLARDLCCRLDGGWSRVLESPRAGIFYQWENALPSNYQTAGSDIYLVLKNIAIPDRWRPDSADDPILMEVFKKHWPIEPDSSMALIILDGTGGMTIEYGQKGPLDV
jgi:hypothetical protein